MSRFAFAIFADDLRFEVGNKQTLVGIYRSVMYVQSFPLVVPKLCVSVWVRSPIERPLKSLKVRLLAEDKALVEQVFPDIPEIKGFQEGEADFRPQIHLASFNLLLSQLPLEEPTVLRVRVDAEDEELKAGALRIVLNEKAALANT